MNFLFEFIYVSKTNISYIEKNYSPKRNILINFLLGLSVFGTIIAVAFQIKILVLTALIIDVILISTYCVSYLFKARHSFKYLYSVLLIYAFIDVLLAFYYISNLTNFYILKDYIVLIVLIVTYFISLLSLCLMADIAVAQFSIYTLNLTVTVITALFNIFLQFQTNETISDRLNLSQEFIMSIAELNTSIIDVYQLIINIVAFSLLFVGVLIDWIVKAYVYWLKCNQLGD